MLAYEQAAELGFLKPSHVTIAVSEVSSEGSVFGSHQQRSWPIVSCTVQTHTRDDPCPRGLTLQIERTEEKWGGGGN